MSIRFPCVNCQKRIKVSDGNHGKKVQCPSCGFQQRVPDESIEDVAPAAASPAGTSAPPATPVPPASPTTANPLAPSTPAASVPPPAPSKPSSPNVIEPASSGSVSGHSFVHAPESSGELDPAAALAAALQGGPKAAPAKPPSPAPATPAAVTPVAPAKPAPLIAPTPQPMAVVAPAAANKSNPPQPMPMPVVGGAAVPKPAPTIVPRPATAPPAPAVIVKPAPSAPPVVSPARSGVVSPVVNAEAPSSGRPVDPRPASPPTPSAASPTKAPGQPTAAPITRPAAPGPVAESAPMIAPTAAPTDADFDPLAALASLSNGASSGEIVVPVDFTLSGGESQIDPVHEMLPMSVSPSTSVQPSLGAGLIVTDDVKAQPSKAPENDVASPTKQAEATDRSRAVAGDLRPEVPTAAVVSSSPSSEVTSSESSLRSAQVEQAAALAGAGHETAEGGATSQAGRPVATPVALSRPSRPEPITLAGPTPGLEDEGGEESDPAEQLARQQASDSDEPAQDFPQSVPRAAAAGVRARRTAGSAEVRPAASQGLGRLPLSAVAAVWALRAIAAVLAIAVILAMVQPDGEQMKFPLVLRVVIASVGLIVPAMAWGLAEILNVLRPGGRG